MVRLYKALTATGASVEIKPNKKPYCMLFIFQYRGRHHTCSMDMLDPEKYLDESEDKMDEELYSFVRYVKAVDGDFDRLMNRAIEKS